MSKHWWSWHTFLQEGNAWVIRFIFRQTLKEEGSLFSLTATVALWDAIYASHLCKPGAAPLFQKEMRNGANLSRHLLSMQCNKYSNHNVGQILPVQKDPVRNVDKIVANRRAGIYNSRETHLFFFPFISHSTSTFIKHALIHAPVWSGRSQINTHRNEPRLRQKPGTEKERIAGKKGKTLNQFFSSFSTF